MFVNAFSEFGKQPSVANVYNGMVMIRRGDGALVASSFYTFFISLHQHILNKRWKEALSLCRIAQVINIYSLLSNTSKFLDTKIMNRMKYYGLAWLLWQLTIKN